LPVELTKHKPTMWIRRENPAMSDPTPSPLARVHVGGHGRERSEAAARPEPLQIAYSTTRVLPDALLRLQRHVGVVKGDRSELSETFKMLRNRLLLRMRADGHRVLAVTSPRDIEGKSLTAVNLALTLAADYDTAVLLIDADLPRHNLQRLFGLEGQPGLGEHLSSGAPLADLFINPGVDRMVLLPAGANALPNSAELLATKAAQHLINEVKQRYSDRYIVVDLPPLLDTADALAFLPHVDTTLVVVEDHSTSQADVERATELMAPFNLVGTVISRARPKGEPGSAAREPWYRRWLKPRVSAASAD
jgi:capsular exopolysaccharide synthesis family protein